MKDHEFRELVNTLRDVALQYHNHESLRERIRHALSDALKRQEPVAYKHRDGMLSSRLPGGPVLGIDWTPLYAAPVPQAPSAPKPEGFALVNAAHFLAVLDREDWRTAKNRAELRAMLAAAPQPERSTYRSQALDDVLAERRRQIETEGWTPEHDDEHIENEMALAAACYAMSAGGYAKGKVPPVWPWMKEWWKPSTPRRDMVKAAALILAEIERLDRAERSAGDERGAS